MLRYLLRMRVGQEKLRDVSCGRIDHRVSSRRSSIDSILW